MEKKRFKLDGTPRKDFNTLGHKAHGGRPPKEIDEDTVKKLASIMCTMEEIAYVVGCSVDTLENRFSEIIKEGKAKGRTSLRRHQFLAAEKGNTAMLIWLGKQFLGQSEKQQIVQYTSEAPFEIDELDKKEALDIVS